MKKTLQKLRVRIPQTRRENWHILRFYAILFPIICFQAVVPGDSLAECFLLLRLSSCRLLYGWLFLPFARPCNLQTAVASFPAVSRRLWKSRGKSSVVSRSAAETKRVPEKLTRPIKGCVAIFRNLGRQMVLTVETWLPWAGL